MSSISHKKLAHMISHPHPLSGAADEEIIQFFLHTTAFLFTSGQSIAAVLPFFRCVNTPRLQDNCIKKNEICHPFPEIWNHVFFPSVLVFQKWIDSACSKAHMWMSASIINNIPEALGETIQPRCIPGFCHQTQCLCLTRLQCPTSLCSWSGYFGRLQALTPWSQLQSKISFSSNMWTVLRREDLGYLAKSSLCKKGGDSGNFGVAPPGSGTGRRKSWWVEGVRVF